MVSHPAAGIKSDTECNFPLCLEDLLRDNACDVVEDFAGIDAALVSRNAEGAEMVDDQSAMVSTNFKLFLPIRGVETGEVVHGLQEVKVHVLDVTVVSDGNAVLNLYHDRLCESELRLIEHAELNDWRHELQIQWKQSCQFSAHRNANFNGNDFVLWYGALWYGETTVLKLPTTAISIKSHDSVVYKLHVERLYAITCAGFHHDGVAYVNFLFLH